MPDKPVPEDDPIVSKSLAPHYVVAMIVLMATLFWALWDEDFGQRPWKTFQDVWKDRYTAFLKTARSQSSDSQKDVESSADYQSLKQAYEQANRNAAPRVRELNEKLRDLSARILAAQNVFTDRRAYVNASTYAIETGTSTSSKQSRQKDLDKYKQEVTTVVYPDGSTQKYNYDQLEEAYNELKNERTNLTAELGEVIKPVNGDTWRLELSGLVADKRPWTLHDLQSLPQASMRRRAPS